MDKAAEWAAKVLSMDKVAEWAARVLNMVRDKAVTDKVVRAQCMDKDKVVTDKVIRDHSMDKVEAMDKEARVHSTEAVMATRVHNMDKVVMARVARVLSMDKVGMDKVARVLNMDKVEAMDKARNMDKAREVMDKETRDHSMVREVATDKAVTDKDHNMSKEAATRVHRMNHFSDRVVSMSKAMEVSDKECMDNNQKGIHKAVSRNGKEGNMVHAVQVEWVRLPTVSKEAMTPIVISSMVMKVAADTVEEWE